MTGDEQKNYDAIREWSGQIRGLEEFNVPAEALINISPMYFFGNITAAVSIHHGTADALVPMEWSQTTCGQLQSLGKAVECIYYENMPHTFHGDGNQQFIQNTVEFFDRYLKTP
jgi:dipeptidyl aminopeptidase/acylaminoacyl peptidase